MEKRLHIEIKTNDFSYNGDTLSLDDYKTEAQIMAVMNEYVSIEGYIKSQSTDDLKRIMRLAAERLEDFDEEVTVINLGKQKAS